MAGGGFLRLLRLPPPIKHHHDITEILLKVVFIHPNPLKYMLVLDVFMDDLLNLNKFLNSLGV